MDLLDARGLAVSAADAAALALYEAALASLHGTRGDAAARNDAALARDPRLVAARCLRAAALVLAGGAASRAPLAAALGELDALAGSANDRERRHAAAARAWLDGDANSRWRVTRAIVVDYPRDSLALQVAHALDFRLGHREMLRDRIAEVLPHWDASVPGYGYVLGMYAFGLEENGDYARAEARRRESLRLEPDNASAVHVIAHVMEMQGRAKRRHRLARSDAPDLDGQRRVLGPPRVAPRVVPHRHRRHAGGDQRSTSTRWRRHAATATSALIDATALLWRLELRGVHVRRLWRELANHWARSALAGERAFTLVHAPLAFAAADVAHLGARVAALLRHDPATRAANTAQDLALAVPLTEGLHAYSRGDYAAAVERMTTVRAVAYRCGGSVAQCDLIHLTLLEAALRSQQARLAQALAAERVGAQAGQPAQPLAMRSGGIRHLAGSALGTPRWGEARGHALVARLRDEHLLHALVDLLGRVVRRIAPDDAARAIDEELGEVPLDRLGAEHAGLLRLEPAVQRMCGRRR